MTSLPDPGPCTVEAERSPEPPARRWWLAGAVAVALYLLLAAAAWMTDPHGSTAPLDIVVVHEAY